VMIPNKPILRRQASVLKDLDFNRTVWLEEKTRTKLLKQLESDTLFLQQHNLMDYSLLLGIAHRPPSFTLTSLQKPSPSPASPAATVGEHSPIKPADVSVKPSKKEQPLQLNLSLIKPQDSPKPIAITTTTTEEPAACSAPDSVMSGDLMPKTTNAHKRRSFLCFVEETYDPQLQNVPKRLTGALSPRPPPPKGTTPRTPRVTVPAQDPNGQKDGAAFSPRSAGATDFDSSICDTPRIVGQPVVMQESKAISYWTNLPSCDPASCADELYYLGVIDFLTVYDTQKRLSGFFQSVRHGRESVSTVSPEFYARRFMQMAMADISATQHVDSPVSTTAPPPVPAEEPTDVEDGVAVAVEETNVEKKEKKDEEKEKKDEEKKEKKDEEKKVKESEEKEDANKAEQKKKKSEGKKESDKTEEQKCEDKADKPSEKKPDETAEKDKKESKHKSSPEKKTKSSSSSSSNEKKPVKKSSSSSSSKSHDKKSKSGSEKKAKSTSSGDDDNKKQN